MKRGSSRLGLLAVTFAATLWLPTSALAVSPPPNGSTTISFSPLPPITTDGGPGADVTLTSLTVSSVPDQIDNGKVTFEFSVDGVGCVTPSGSVVSWIGLNAPGQNPAGADHDTTLPVDIDALPCFLPGATIGFRAHYVTGGGPSHVDTHFSPGVDLATVAAPCDGLTIAATLGSGNGTPTPGTNADWVFRIAVKNCTGGDLAGVKVQGGTSGWTIYKGAVTTPPGETVSFQTKNKTSILTWVTDLVNGQEKDIDVMVNGSIGAKALCSPDPLTPVPGTTLYLSGPWSALAGALKPYSTRVSIVVTCAPPLP
jgi:hypothetical protein